MHRRTFVAAAGIAGFAGLAGCGGLPDEVTVTAQPATIESATASDAGYETAGPESFELERSVDVAGESRLLRATTWTTAYTGEAGPLIVLSTPDVTVAGQSLNPLAQLSGTELIARLLEEFASGSELSVSELEPAGNTPVTVFEKEATIEEFTGVVESSGSGGPTNQFTGNTTSSDGVPIRLFLLSVSHTYNDDTDVIFSLSFQPQAQTDPETIYTLYESLQHPVSPPASANSSQ
jgi:hypothetical protein